MIKALISTLILTLVLTGCEGAAGKSSVVASSDRVTSKNDSKSSNRQKEQKIVESLYQQFKPLEPNALVQKGLLDLSEEELGMYFTKSMVQLLLEEAKCVKDGLICALSFDPLYGSQDPSVLNIKVKMDKNSVAVHIKEKKQTKVLMYIFDSTNEPRIKDILYPNNVGLYKLLSAP